MNTSYQIKVTVFRQQLKFNSTPIQTHLGENFKLDLIPVPIMVPKTQNENDNYFIEMAKKTNGFIISNDNLRDYPDKDIKKKLLPFILFEIIES